MPPNSTQQKLAELYLQRWQVELFFRDIKTTLGMDVLRRKTPDMVEKEIIMHFIAYNSIRMRMYEAAEEARVDADRLSFREPYKHGANGNLTLSQPDLTNGSALKSYPIYTMPLPALKSLTARIEVSLDV